MPSANVRSMTMLNEGGMYRVPSDSGQGVVSRPFATGEYGGRIATLETLYDFFINHVPDPDSAMAQDPNFDEKIRQQPDVHACMRIRELTVAGMPVKIIPSTERGIDLNMALKVADYVDDAMNRLPNRSELYRQMQMAVLMGGQGHEFVWEKVNGYAVPISYHAIHKSRFVFDRIGNMGILTREQPVWGAYVGQNPNRSVKPVQGPDGQWVWPTPGGKFTYHKYMAEGGPWYRPAAEGYNFWGRGEDTNLYVPVSFDNFVIRFRLKWLEKHGMPLTVLYHPDNMETSKEVLRIAESIRGESVVTIPRPVGEGTENYKYKLDFIDPPSTGYDAFQEFSERWTRPAVEKILLGGANLLEVGDKGSYAATVAQRDAGAQIIFKYDARKIDETIDTQLIPYIVQHRWPGIPTEYYPHQKTAPEENVDQEMQMRLIQMAAELVPVRRQDVYTAAGLERPTEKEMQDAIFVGQSPQQPGQPGQAGEASEQGAKGKMPAKPGVRPLGKLGPIGPAGRRQEMAPRAPQGTMHSESLAG